VLLGLTWRSKGRAASRRFCRFVFYPGSAASVKSLGGTPLTFTLGYRKMLPPYLYKYTSFDNKKYLHEIINENKVYFTSPNYFNDPFDCKSNFNIGSTASDIENTREFIFKMLEEDTSLSSELIRAIVNRIGSKWDGNLIIEEFRKTLANRGIYCLTNKPDNLLMWSHYGDSHRGLCFEFSTTPNGSFFSNANPVKYTDTYPTIGSYLSWEDCGDTSFLVKSQEWEYEQEYRIISNYAGHLEYPKELLVGIIFGCNVAYENIELVTSWISSRDTEINLFKTSTNKEKFKLDISKI